MYFKRQRAILRRFAAIVPVWALQLAPAAATETPGTQPVGWIEHFTFKAPSAGGEGLCAPSSRALPTFKVTPAAIGRQLVRVSLPFAPGTFSVDSGLLITANDRKFTPAVRPLTYHPGRPQSIRRAIVTFVYDFPDLSVHSFGSVLTSRSNKQTQSMQSSPAPGIPIDGFVVPIGKLTLRLDGGSLRVDRDGHELLLATLEAPPLRQHNPPTLETIESNAHYVWVRLLVPDPDWPRILEVRADVLGTVAVRGHLQRLQPTQDGRPRAPTFGWRVSRLNIKLPKPTYPLPKVDPQIVRDPAFVQTFGDEPVSLKAGEFALDFPDAHLHRRGLLAATEPTVLTYYRCLASEQVPHQLAAWRTATFVLRPEKSAPWSELLEPSHRVQFEAGSFASIYGTEPLPDLTSWTFLTGVTEFHRDAIATCLLPGDDFGNVSSMPTGSVFGMNRLNHDPAIFEEYYRSNDTRLRRIAIAWCDNMHDLSLWWGDDKPNQFGGTRYNNMAAHHPEYKDDKTFMWRSDTAVDFCTKGFDAFFYAYEETGDPRMANAFYWQSQYAAQHMHLKTEMRDIGDVLDFLRLYRFTGQAEYREHALRFFRELRTHLSPDNLFSQNGGPIVPDTHFIADDAEGYKYPYAKPYIIGYALAGLPELAVEYPDEPRLVDVIRAVAQFLARSQDPTGGWRYPHPRSPGVNLGQSIEHASQIVNAAEYLESRGESIGSLLDAIERTLQARILAWQKSREFLSGLGSWEQAAGLIKDQKDWYERYKQPGDRDAARDYTEGSVGLGGAPPEGVVYFFKVLAFYLKHRPAERLLYPNDSLQKVLARIAPKTLPTTTTQASEDYPQYGVAQLLPTFSGNAIGRLNFPLRYDPGKWPSFSAWKNEARRTLLRTMLTPPLRAEFDPIVIAREDREGYEARKLLFSVSRDCRIPAYLLVPKGTGPFPAVLALHDHGAFFEIGKEKVIRPFNERAETIQAAEKWADKCYGGQFIGDALARRGYVVLAIDALFWGDRGRKEGVDYTAQQALASNLFHLGMSWLGVITWDDMRSAEFLASLPQVDPQRIATVGLSMGSHRAWMLAALSDRIAAGLAICWMGTTRVLMAPGNNQTKGHSGYSMLAPDLSNYLDCPDVASLACPKPMLFYNGEQDGLFPLEGVRDAYDVMNRVWNSQRASAQLETRIWPKPHVFDTEMQEAAFSWLDRQLGQPHE